VSEYFMLTRVVHLSPLDYDLVQADLPIGIGHLDEIECTVAATTKWNWRQNSSRQDVQERARLATEQTGAHRLGHHATRRII
jgi:hypothetical protein